MKRLALVLLLLATTALGAEYNIGVLLNERNAILVKSSSAKSLESDRFLTRFWKAVPNRFLEDVASDVRARRTETNPKADQRVYAGLWRISSVEIQRGKTGDGQLIEHLQFGLATSLPDSEARLGEAVGDPKTSGFRFRQFWPYVDPQSADTLLVSLNDATVVTNPVADAQTYTGTFVVAEISSKRLDDAAIEISRTLGKVSLVTNAGDLASLPHRLTEDHEILKLFGFETGEGRNLGLIWDNISPDVQTQTNVMRTITDAQLVSSNAPGWTYSDRHWKIQKDNSATFAVAFRSNVWNVWSGNTNTTYNEITYRNRTRDGESRVKTWEGIQIIDSTQAINAVSGFTDSSEYNVIEAAVTDNGDGSVALRQTTLKRVVEAATTGTDALDGERGLNPLGWEFGTNAVKRSVYRNYTKTAAASLTDTVPSTYKLIDKSSDIDANGLYTVVFTYHTNTWANLSGTSLLTTNTYAHINVDIGGGTNGRDRQHIVGADGIPIGAIESVRDAWQPVNGWFQDSLRVSDNKDGSASLRSQETLARGTNLFVKRRFEAGRGKRNEAETIEWYHLTATNSQVLYSDAFTNQTDMYQSSIPSPTNHQLFSIDQNLQANGSYVVVRKTYIPDVTSGNTAWPPDTGTQTNLFNTRKYRQSPTNDAIDQVRVFTWLKSVSYHADSDSASAAMGGVSEQGTKVDRIGDRKWRTTRVESSDLGTWANE